VTNYTPPAARADNLRFRCHHLHSAFLKLGSVQTRGSEEGCHGFRDTKMRNGGLGLLVVLNLYVPFNIRMPTFDNDHSVTDNTQSIITSILKEASSFCSHVRHHSSP